MRRPLSTVTITMALASLALSGCSDSLTKEESCAAVSTRVELALKPIKSASSLETLSENVKPVSKDLAKISRDADNKQIESLVQDISESVSNTRPVLRKYQKNQDNIELVEEAFDEIDASIEALEEACV